MDIKYADKKGKRPVFSSSEYFNFEKYSAGICQLLADLKFKTSSNKAIPKQQFLIHRLCDTCYIPP